MAEVLDLWKRASGLPWGDRVFSYVFARRAPYFATVRPRFTDVRPHHASLGIRDRRRVHNHLGTIHAIALCNGLEAAMGALAEATITADRRWIPKGMEVTYTAKADSDVVCHAETTPADWVGPDVPVRVHAVRRDGTTVVEGTIRLWVTDRPSQPNPRLS
ncbi:MAG: hotdog fold domain-containing protein [Nocardioides sp.]